MNMYSYKELPKSLGMQLVSFAPKRTQISILVYNRNNVFLGNVHIYIDKSTCVPSVQFFARTTPGSFGLPVASIAVDCFPLGIQDFLNKFLTK